MDDETTDSADLEMAKVCHEARRGEVVGQRMLKDVWENLGGGVATETQTEPDNPLVASAAQGEREGARLAQRVLNHMGMQ
ncbi:MAG: hypothetical protein IJ849_04925 [Selenomonadaceae bacterium]|nr:hypothetical protein [Selenomonadaceae bacterium]